MKKAMQFFRSMKFGLILLGIIALISLAGSLIPQGESPMTYVRAYPKFYSAIFFLQLDHVFTSWYFIAAVVLLCLNLIGCSLIRAGRLFRKDEVRLPESAAVKLDSEGIGEVRSLLEKEHCRKTVQGDAEVYVKNEYGKYGSFLTHLGILLTVIFFTMAMYMPVTIDRTCMPGESLTMDDGTVIFVEDFSILNDEDRLDYASVVNVTLPDGSESGAKRVSVNHPLKFKEYKVYQQTYGTKGRITIDRNGHSDTFYIDAGDFLSADGANGILIDNLYPDYIEQDGKMSLVTSTSGRYEHPVYVYTTVLDGQQQEVMLAFPHDSSAIADFTFTFEDPVEYPGLRIKKTPGMINALLLIAVIIMTAGLALALFCQPVQIVLGKDGYTELSNRDEGLHIELGKIRKKYGGE